MLDAVNIVQTRLEHNNLDTNTYVETCSAYNMMPQCRNSAALRHYIG